MTPTFENAPEAIFEASSLIARQKLQTLEHAANEQVLSRGFESFYKSGPVSEAIDDSLR